MQTRKASPFRAAPRAASATFGAASPPLLASARRAPAHGGTAAAANNGVGSARPVVAAADVLAAISRSALHETVAAQLRDLITEGVLAPGDRLNERVLCEQLQVSRTPLREACKVLAAEGLIRLLPHRGAVVTQLSVEAVAHTFELMGALEAANGELAASRATVEDIRTVSRLTREMKSAHARQDLPAYYRLNQAIHERIASAAGNPVLAETYRTTNARLQAFRFRSNLDRAKWKLAMKEHEVIAQALAARDAGRLGSLLREHLAHKRDIVLAQLAAAAAAPQ